MLALSVVILMNLVGNTLIIITVYKHKELRRTVNYFIVNVAFSDLIYALCDISVEATNMAKSSIQWLITGTAVTVQNTFPQYNIKLPCKAEKPLSFIGDLMFFLSTSINPVICFAFIGSYRNGLREIANSWLDFCGCQRSREKNPETARIKRITPQNVRFIMETEV
ncbi:uncharacterized protein LOC141892745 [Acropora palmata]|uniref:uncharacterized protein LOC141892745 n=1 Tax=Acropora palmata TaxID=6131 RepID=UPI003D9FF406